jgi:short-subunit dehydrogenase
VTLTIVARSKVALGATAEEIRNACGVTVTSVATDIATEEGRKQHSEPVRSQTSSSIMPGPASRRLPQFFR